MGQVWKYYDVSGGELVRRRRECPRCKGSFLAEHDDRFSCGKCGFTEFRKKNRDKEENT